MSSPDGESANAIFRTVLGEHSLQDVVWDGITNSASLKEEHARLRQDLANYGRD
jgi:hypothetical protein